MDNTSSRKVATIAGAGQDALCLLDALSALSMHDTGNSHETSDEHDTEDFLEKKNPVGSFFAIVSFGLSYAVLYLSLTSN